MAYSNLLEITQLAYTGCTENSDLGMCLAVTPDGLVCCVKSAWVLSYSSVYQLESSPRGDRSVVGPCN